MLIKICLEELVSALVSKENQGWIWGLGKCFVFLPRKIPKLSYNNELQSYKCMCKEYREYIEEKGNNQFGITSSDSNF